MSSPLSYTESPAIAGAEATNLEFERFVRRAKKLSRIVGEFGLINAARIVFDWQTGRETDFMHRNPKSFREPLQLTTALSDINTCMEVASEAVYELPSGLSERVNGSQIVDIGANIGLSAAYFASRYPDSPVTAIEPNSRNFYYLATNIRPYQDQIGIIKSALAPEPGLVNLNTPPGIDLKNHACYLYSGRPEPGQESSSHSIAVTPQDILAFVKKYIGLLKIDIEGAEKHSFESGKMDPLLAITDVLAIETHERFIPGSDRAVHQAALSNGMVQHSDNGHTKFYVQA